MMEEWSLSEKKAAKERQRLHQWWWTIEPRHAPCAQCDDGKLKHQIPLDLVWGMGGDFDE